MNKNYGLLFGVTLVPLFTGIALATPSASSEVLIYAFDQKPAVYESCTEWVTLNNPSNESVEIGNWTLENAAGERKNYPGRNYPFSIRFMSPPYQWRDNSAEAITLSVSEAEEVDSVHPNPLQHP